MNSFRLLFLSVVVSCQALAQDAGVRFGSRDGGPCVVNPKSRFNLYFDRAELFRVINTFADITCKTFVLAAGIENTQITISTPERGELTAEQLFAAFVAAVETNGLKVVDKGGIVRISK
jgi:general secretion pathway protein D